MFSKHTKRCSSSLPKREMQIKQRDSTKQLTRRAIIIFKIEKSKVWEDREKLQPSYTADENIKWKTGWQFLNSTLIYLTT